jgi:catechol 2,3-dioxygenase-like lactoylglutathione lyase family enzyme
LGAVCLSLIFTAGNKKTENTIQFVEIGVNVSDTVRSLDFYTKIFGMKRVGYWHVPTEMSIEAGVNSGRAFDLVILQLECDDYVLNYKLNQTENNKNTAAAKAVENYSFEKTGLGYLTFNVKNVDPYIERIIENNIKYKLVILPNLPRVVLLHDPDGALLEIYERKD